MLYLAPIISVEHPILRTHLGLGLSYSSTKLCSYLKTQYNRFCGPQMNRAPANFDHLNNPPDPPTQPQDETGLVGQVLLVKWRKSRNLETITNPSVILAESICIGSWQSS